MKALIVIALVGIVVALASAGAFMLRRDRSRRGDDAPPDRQMARALAVRVAISVTLFLLVLIAWALGWVRPGGLPTGH